MTHNKQLERAISGKFITLISTSTIGIVVMLNDGTRMTVQAESIDLPKGPKFTTTFQSGTTLRFNFDDTSTHDILLLKEGSSVFVRDGNGNFAYSN